MKVTNGKPDRDERKDLLSNQFAWAFLPIMLLLSGLVLLLFGASWWTTLMVVFALACLGCIGVGIYMGYSRSPGSDGPA